MGCHICNLLGLLIALLCYWEYASSFRITYFSIRLWKCYFRYRCQQFISKINGLFFIKWDKFSFRIRTFCHIMSNLHFHLCLQFVNIIWLYMIANFWSTTICPPPPILSHGFCRSLLERCAHLDGRMHCPKSICRVRHYAKILAESLGAV